MGLIGFVAELLVLGCICCGVAANLYVVLTCEMLELRNGGKIGPWRAQIGRDAECEVWNKADADEVTDWLLNMARATSMMGLCFGGIFAICLLFHQCLFPLPCGQKLMDISASGVQISLALTWAITWSDVCDDFGGCSRGDGAYALMACHAFYLGASIFNRCMREPRYKRREERREEESKHQPSFEMQQNSDPQVRSSFDDDQYEKRNALPYEEQYH